MAFDISDKKRRRWNLKYTNTRGGAVAIDLTKSPTEITQVPDGGADVTMVGFDTVTGTQTLLVAHNPSVGLVSITVKNDGDMGDGVVPITATEDFNMLAPGGSDAVQSTVDAEEDIV